MNFEEKITQTNFSMISEEELRNIFSEFTLYSTGKFSTGQLLPPDEVDKILSIHSLIIAEAEKRNIKL